MTQEELKTCLGQLLLDLRSDWSYAYEARLQSALELCNLIEGYTEDVKIKILEELEDPYEGRTFKGVSYYGYIAEEGRTERVKKWLKDNLNYPEYCEVFE